MRPINYAVLSDSIEALDWFKKYFPEQVYDNYLIEPISNAAEFGTIKVLDWFEILF